MRSILENVEAYGLKVKRGFQKTANILAIAADQTLVTNMPVIQAYDPANTTRNVTLEAITVASEGLEKEIWNIGTGTGNLTLKNAGGTTIATIPPGSRAIVKILNQTWFAFIQGVSNVQNASQKSTISLYTKLADLVNTNIMAVNVPFAFTCTAARFRPRTPATTGAKAATLTAGIASTGTGALTNMTGGVLSLTSANMTPTNTPLASTTITALNTGVAGASLGATVSAVTAFAEGDGYLEFDVTNTALD
jgi:hypothetical protein